MALTEKQKIAHLLRRFGLGASEAEMEFYGKKGLPGAIDLLLDVYRPDGWTYESRDFTGRQQNLNVRALQSWWASRLVISQSPLLEKMTLFWHDHFATSFQKVDSGPAMMRQNEILRMGALGNFQDLLMSVSKDPAMVFWLDNQLNVKGKANENFAREIMELFTLGIGHYTEKDVKETARAFTGWGFSSRARARSPQGFPRGGAGFRFNPEDHDDEPKTILGQTGNFAGEDVVRMLCRHPETARHLTRKIWSFFAYENPSDTVVDRHARVFADNRLNIAELLKSIMHDPEFYSERAVRRLFKNPADFCIATLRQLGAGSRIKEMIEEDRQRTERTAAPAVAGIAASSSMKNMGMEIFLPPDVAGWDWGASWITSATMVERIKWADRLWGNQGGGGGRVQALRWPAAVLIPADRKPETFARDLASIFDAGLPEEKQRLIDTAAKKIAPNGLNALNANATAHGISRLLFAAPEFHLS